MTRRREFLSGTAVFSIGTVAGCLDNLSENNQGNGSSENAEDDNPSSPSSSDNTNDNSGENSDSIDESNDRGEEDDTGIEDRQTRQEIVETYEEGISDYNDGIEARESGVGAWNNDQLSDAESYYESAETHFRDAKDHFANAVGLCFEIDHAQAREECEKAERKAQLWINAMREGQASARAAQRDDAETANNRLDEMRDFEQEADQVAMRNSGILKSILDLD